MNKHSEQNATNGDLADRNLKQNMALDAGVSSLPISDVKDLPKRMVHAYIASSISKCNSD